MTRRYDVYGIGNALVDMEFKVDDAFLERHAISKGHMTLVDAETQQRLAAELEGQAARRGSGGSAANSLIAVANFGGRAFYSCKVAEDDTGRFFVHDLNAAGVDTNAHDAPGDGVSGQSLVMITPDAERTMNTFLGISASLDRDTIDEDALASSAYLYIEGYLCTSDSARAAAIELRERARALGVKIAVTLSDPSMVEIFRPQLSEMIGEHVDHLFCNQEEALDWTGTTHVEDAVEVLRKQADTFAITLGKNGSLIWDGAQVLRVPAQPVAAVDTTGAGDIYAGGFLYGLTNGLGYVGAGQLASRAAAELVSSYGARLPDQAAHQAVLAAAKADAGL